MTLPTDLALPASIIVPFADEPIWIAPSAEWTELVGWTKSSEWSGIEMSIIVQVTLYVANATTVDFRVTPSQSGVCGDEEQASILSKNFSGPSERSIAWDNRLKRFIRVEVRAAGDPAAVHFEIVGLADLPRVARFYR